MVVVAVALVARRSRRVFQRTRNVPVRARQPVVVAQVVGAPVRADLRVPAHQVPVAQVLEPVARRTPR